MAKKEKTARTTLNSGRSCPTKLTEDSKRVLYGFLRSDKFKEDVVVPYNDYTAKKMQYRPAVGGKPLNGRAAAGQFLTDRTIQIIRDLQLVSSISTPIAGKFEKRTALINDSVDNIRDHVMYAITDINKARPFVGWTYLCTKVKKLKVNTNPQLDDPYKDMIKMASDTPPASGLNLAKAKQLDMIGENGEINIDVEKKDEKGPDDKKAKNDRPNKNKNRDDSIEATMSRSRYWQKKDGQEIKEMLRNIDSKIENLSKSIGEYKSKFENIHAMEKANARVLSTLSDVLSLYASVYDQKKGKQE